MHFLFHGFYAGLHCLQTANSLLFKAVQNRLRSTGKINEKRVKNNFSTVFTPLILPYTLSTFQELSTAFHKETYTVSG